MSKVNKKNYLDAVRRLKTQSAQVIGNRLKVPRMTVHRFKKKYPDAVSEGEAILKELSQSDSKIVWTSRINQWDYFNNLEIIKTWRQALSDDRVGKRKANAYIRSFWYVCKELRVHPDKANIDDVAEVVKTSKRAYYAVPQEKVKRGLAYTSIREGVRSFFTRMKRVSGEYLSQIGITKEGSLGQGKYAKQKVPQNVRHELERLIMMSDKLTEHEKLEAVYADKLMYYWGNRVECITEYNFRTRPHLLSKDVWEFTVLDKGEYGGKEWEKELIDYALEDFKEYASKRFNIPIDRLEIELPKATDKLFPIMTQDKLRAINKELLPLAGLSYEEFPPNHIFRHTFAQDGLDATDHNYELVAELGGWESSETLKRHYGKINKSAKRRGLRRMMKLPVKEVKSELRW